MNNQKDTQKTDLNSYGQSNVLDFKTFNNKTVYEFANKKTEKLVTALYMVTDCMDTDDALKSKLRELGVSLLSGMYNLSSVIPQDKHLHITGSLSRIYEIISFVEIANTIGFISDMNTLILKREFMVLIKELEGHQGKDKHFTFMLDENMFSLPENIVRQDLTMSREKSGGSIKDNNIKRTNFNNMSFTNSRQSFPKVHNFSESLPKKQISDKGDRSSKILDLITNSLPNGQDGVSIKDISNSFTDCSEKTIQRELNALVSKGQIKKTGLKRWSKYSIITK